MAIYYGVNEDSYLAHHGVKGQQWGVRRGPPYPIEDTVMKKGTRINSVSSSFMTDQILESSKNGRWLYAYNPNDEWDSDVYRGPFSVYVAQRAVSRGASYVSFLRDHEFVTTKDMRMPTKKERIDEFEKLIDDKKYGKEVKKTLKQTVDTLIRYNVGSQEELARYRKFNPNKPKSDIKTAYNIFNHAMESMHSFKSTQEYGRRMAEKYDAMVDDNNQGVYNRAHDPIIIFKASEFVKDCSDPNNPRFLSADDIRKSYDRVKAELSKYGEKVKL